MIHLYSNLRFTDGGQGILDSTPSDIPLLVLCMVVDYTRRKQPYLK
jgi:hypothetical protein